MAMRWNKYGPIWISAGMFLTGVIWFQRPNVATIRGEDAAEIRAAAEECLMAWNVTDDYSPTKYDSLATNWIVATNLSATVTFYKKSSNADYANNFFTLSAGTFTFNQSNYSNWQEGVVTLSSAITNKSYPSGYGSAWGVVMGGVSNPPTAPPWSIPLRTQYDANALGVPAELDPNRNVTYVVETTNANWSMPAASAASFYVRLTAQPTNVVTLIETNGFEVYTNVATAGKIGDVIRVRDFSTAMDALREKVLNAGPAFALDPTYAPVDGEPMLSADVYAEPYQSSTSHNWAAYASQVQTRYREGGPTNVAQHARTADSRAISDTDGVRVWQPKQSPNTLTNVPVAAQFYGSSYQLAPVALTFDYDGGNWWTHSGMGTSLYYYAWQRPVTNAVYGYEETGYKLTVRRSDLDNARNLLTNLVRTADLHAFFYVSNVVWLESQAVTNASVYEENSDMFAPFVPAVSAVYTNAFSYSYVSELELVSETMEWDSLVDGQYTNGQASVVYRRRLSADVRQRVWHGYVRPRYPCAYAYTNGYVARVRVYGVFDNDTYVDDAEATLGNATRPGYMTEEYVNAWQPQLWTQEAYGLAVTLQDVPEGYPAEASDTAQSWGSLGLMRGSRVTLLADVSDPAESPVIEIGLTAPAFSTFDDAQGVAEAITYSATNNTALHYVDKRHSLRLNRRTLEMTRMIVVADWRWKHMNADNPYEPAPWTPEWARTNAP